MCLYKIEIIVNGLCNEICYVNANTPKEAKEKLLNYYDIETVNSVVIKNMTEIYGVMILGD